MRKYYIDYLRVVLMIGVIILHVSANNWYGYVETNRWIVFTIYSCNLSCGSALFLYDLRSIIFRR